MSLSTQFKLLNAMRDFLTDEGKFVLPSNSEPKPTFLQGLSPLCALPRCAPEAVGLDSHQLEEFVRQIASTPDVNAHSLLILRKGHIICEGYFSPYRKELWHICHSVSKSFISTAVGMAIDEGLFHIEDPLTDFFADQLGILGRRRIKNLTVRHLLNMTSGISFNELSELVESDWVRGIFSSSLTHEPGSHFEYNSLNSYLLAVLIYRTSGQTVIDYLKPRLFEPLGFGPIAWEKAPSGIEKGGWGMYALPEDLAKLGQLYLNNGRWNVNGEIRQLLSESWVQSATQRQSGSDTESYGYQMWVDHETGYPIMNGLFGQYVVMIPPLDLCIVMTAGCPRLFHESPAYHLIKQYFFPIQTLPENLPANPTSLSSLSRTLHTLRFRHPVLLEPRIVSRTNTLARGFRWNSRPVREASHSEHLDAFLNTTWRFPQNRAGILPVIVQAMNNNFTAGVCALRMEKINDNLLLFWEEGDITLCLPIGVDAPMEGILRMGEEIFLTACLLEMKCNEDDEDVLRIEICLTEHSSLRILKLQRKGDNLLLRLDEHPQIDDALEVAMNRKGDGFTELSGNGPALGNFIKGNEFLHYRISQLCKPEVTGIPT